MGLDSVELVLRWEEEFGITISDEVACAMLTPRQATEFIFQLVRQRSTTECIRQQTFFRLRKGFRRAIPISVERFGLKTKLEDLVSRREWPRVWSELLLEDLNKGWPAQAPFRGVFAFRGRTVADLVQELALSDTRAIGNPVVGWTREQVSLQVRRVVDEVTGNRHFEEDDEFVRDMGIG